jgi:muramoyltetrapeptide carboxypeptidase
MHRKKFLSSCLGLAGLLPLSAYSNLDEDEDSAGIKPRYLKKGDVIGVTCPAGYITAEDILPAATQMESWGFRVKMGATIGRRDFGFGGTDEERLKDFQRMIDDPEVKAVMCARGGYGALRIVDKIKFDRFATNPKWIIGFSDITVLHCHLNRNYGIASIHSKMCNSFPEKWDEAEPIQISTILSIKDALMGDKMKYEIDTMALNRRGTGEGTLVGGNLKTIETLAGSRSDIKTTNKILFVEDTGEYLYSIDRMFWNLKRSGKLEKLQGLIIGGFKIKPDDPGEEFGRTLNEIVLEKVKEYDYPVCFDFPVGHQKNNYALKCGIRHRLTVGEQKSVLQEISGK